MCGGFGAFYFRTEIKQKNKQKKLKITPVKHCTNFPLINSTLWFCGDGFHKWTELDFWIWTNQGMNWPGRPPTFWTLLTFHFDLCLSTGLLAFRLLRGVVSSRWFVHFLFFVYLSVAMALLLWFSRAALEWRVRSKTVAGADSLWGNKPSHRTPQTPQHRPPSHAHRRRHTFYTVCQITCMLLFCFVFFFFSLLNTVPLCDSNNGCGLDFVSHKTWFWLPGRLGFDRANYSCHLITLKKIRHCRHVTTKTVCQCGVNWFFQWWAIWPREKNPNPQSTVWMSCRL